MAALVLGLLVAAGGGVLARSWRVESGRLRSLALFAADAGWELSPRDRSLPGAYDGQPFGRGSRRCATSVLRGTYRGRRCVAFDYAFTTVRTDGDGQRRPVRHRFAVVTLALPGAVPLLEVEPATTLTRLAGRAGLGGLELESASFNDRFRVRAQDPRAAYEVLTPRTMATLLNRPAAAWRLGDGSAVCWAPGRLQAADVRARADLLADVLDGTPGRLWT